MPLRTKISLTSSLTIFVIYLVWINIPTSMDTSRSILRDACIFTCPIIAALSLFSLPIGYSKVERKATQPLMSIATSLVLIPMVAAGFYCSSSYFALLRLAETNCLA
jgi:hypothetical protein